MAIFLDFCFCFLTIFFCWGGGNFFVFFLFLGFISKLLRLLFKVTKVTTGHQILPKISPNSKISPCLDPKGKKALTEGRSPPQELELGPCSGPYLLVSILTFLDFEISHKLGFKFASICIFTNSAQWAELV